MSIIRLPGLIDVHVHLRDPGQTYKEDFYTGTSAALAGGFTTVLDMPNNKTPITSLNALRKKMLIARKKIVCDVGFYFGSLGDNLEEFAKVKNDVFGLKLYLNMTTGNYLIEEKKIPEVFAKWSSDKPILLHSEGGLIKKMIEYAKFYKRRIHICHISKQSELELVMQAKKNKIKVTCGVTPHHLFLTKKDGKKLGSFAIMKPSLSSQKDVDYLWKHLSSIDIIESDHAPHTIEEKKSANPPYGVPGLETTLPLLLTAEREGKITVKKIIDICYINPQKIFNISPSFDSYLEVDIDESYIIHSKQLKSKCRWTPFEGRKVTGKIKRVVIRDRLVFEDGIVLAKKGFGKVL